MELFLKKHVPENEREGLLEKVLENKSVLSLFDKETKQKSAYFTTKEVRAEEEKLLRFTDAIAGKAADALPLHAVTKGLKNKTLTDEQKASL